MNENNKKSIATSKHLAPALALAVAVIAFLVFLPSLSNGFVNWDDNLLIYGHTELTRFDFDFIKYAFTTTGITASFSLPGWYPLTLISFALDYAIWGMNPYGFHLTNNLFHSINTALVFVLIIRFIHLSNGNERSKRLTLNVIAVAAFTALFFSIHPLRVESVAWATERKDVLYAFFFLLSIISYIKYAAGKERSKKFFLLSLAFFACSLMSKTMAVTLPVVLLLIDYFPIGRIKFDHSSGWFGRHKWALIDKLPFFALSLAVSTITFYTSKEGGTVMALGSHSVFSRLLISVKGYIFYIYKTLWPFDLAPLYPFPAKINFFTLEHIGALLIFLTISAACVWSFKKYKVFSVLWLYYIVTLLPVIGIVQIGDFWAGDRYTYLPSLALIIAVALAVGRAFKEGTNKTVRNAVLAALIAWAVVLAALTIKQSGIWKDSITLWTHQIKIYPNTEQAYNNRGNAYLDAGEKKLAIANYNEGIANNPGFVKLYNNRAMIYQSQGRLAEALADYETGLLINPYNHELHYNRGTARQESNNCLAAINDYTTAIKLAPEFLDSYNNRGICYKTLGKKREAIADFTALLEKQGREDAYVNRAATEIELGELDKAVNDLNAAIKINPESAQSYYNLAAIYLATGERDEGIHNLKMASALGFKPADDYLERLGMSRW